MLNPQRKFETVYTVRIRGESRKSETTRYTFVEKLFKNMWQGLIDSFEKQFPNLKFSSSIRQEINPLTPLQLKNHDKRRGSN